MAQAPPRLALLPHGDFSRMIETELPFKASTAQRLMKISADERLANPAHVQHLPPHWGTLYELTKLPDEQFEAKLATGEIHPEMQRKDVARENRIITRARDEKRVAQLAPVQGKFRTLVVDPPWDYEWLSLAGRAAPGCWQLAVAAKREQLVRSGRERPVSEAEARWAEEGERPTRELETWKRRLT